MDRNKKLRLLTCLYLILGSLFFSSAYSTEPNERQASSQTAAQSQNPTPTKDSLNKQQPRLQRALIIGIIVNLMIILFMSLLYVVKRRMNQFSPVPIKIQPDKNPQASQ